MELIEIYGVTNPSPTSNLSSPGTFTLDNNKSNLTIINTSVTDNVDILIKGARGSVHIPSFADLDITGGLPITIAPLNVVAVNLVNISKHIGEVGDVITISSSSENNEGILFWLR